MGLLGAQAGRAVVVLSSELNGVFPDTETSHNYILLLGPGTSPSLLDYETLNVNASGQATNQSQVAPSVVALTDGSIVVAWQEDIRNPADGAGSVPTDSHVYVQRFTINGSNQLVAVGSPTEIASNTNGSQTQPEATVLANGNVVLVYNTGSADYGSVGNLQRHGDDDDGSDYDVVFRIWNPTTGTFVANQVAVNTTTAGNQYVFNKSVTLLTNGNFVVSWTGDTSAGGPSQVYVRVFNQAGTAVTAQIAISDLVSSTNPNMDATVTALADGGFFVVWTRDNTATNNKDIWGQRFRADGTEVGAEFQINTAGDTTAAPNALAEDQRRPVVTTLANGTVVVTWDSGRYAQEPGFSSRDEEVMQRLIRFGGNNGDDSMAGGTGLDLVFGESGNDKLWGGDADDSLFGATGADTLFGDAGLDRMFGGLGNDTGAGGLGVDTLLGESGADTLDGGSGADTLLGGSGQDWANYTNAAGVAVTIDLAVLTAQSGTGSEGFGDVVAGIEHIFGSAFNDTLSGDGNVNSLLGNNSNDTLAGRGGGDWLDGGAGIDTADYRASAAGVQVILGDGVAESGGDAQGDQLTSIEVIQGSSFADTFGSQAGAATFFGNDGNDLLLARLGAERFEGGAGSDAASYVNSAAAVTVDLTAGTGSGGSAAGDSYSGVETLIGSSGNDILRGAGLAGTPDLIVGGSGADLLRFSQGRDSLVGGSGLDTVSYDGQVGGVHVNLATGSQFDIIAGDPDDTLFGIENLVGSSSADTLLGSAVANTLVGGDGDDVLAGRGAGDSLVGGSGIDTADYTESALAVQVILGDGVTESGGDAAGDNLTLMEVIRGSSFNDTFGSQALAATFFGNAGDDVLQARLGAERLEGGVGNDQVNYLLSTAGVVVNLTTGLGSGGFAAGDSYSGVENIVGSSFVDTLIGAGGTNTIDGQAGNDTLFGELGSDTLLGGLGDDLLNDGGGAAVADRYDGGIGTDTVSYLGAGAAVAADLTAGTGSVGAAAGDVYTGVENLTGDIGADTLGGNASTNVLNGGQGNDTLEGRAGADTLIGDAGLDWASYVNSASAVTVTLGHTGAQTGASGDQIGDVLTGIEAVRGSDVNDSGDTLSSLLGAAILDGGLGDDLLLGGNGTDSYIGGNGSDTVDYRGGPLGVTVDLVSGLGSGGQAQGDLYTQVENVLGTNLTDTLIGGAGFNTLAGFDGIDSLFGGSSGDSLLGGDADDFLMGGSGADRLDGGNGANDMASYTLSTSGVQVNMSDEVQETGGDAQGDRLTGVEHLVGSDFGDQLTGNASVNWLFGESGGDLLAGGGAADSLFGGSGDDAVFFDALDGAIIGGTGRDTLIGTSGSDLIQLSQAKWHFAGAFASFETLQLGDGNDFYNGATDGSDFEQYNPLADGVVLFGGSGNDSLNMRGNSAAFGNNDSVFGGEGRDNIWGGGGDDSLFGDGGDDALYGGFGSDQIHGGAGFDVTYIGRDEGEDAIFDSEGLVLFWGNEPVGGFYDGVDPTEIDIQYTDTRVIITFLGDGNTVAFDKGAVEIINLFDFANGDAGNGAAPPPAFARDIWSASWDSGSQTFTAFTKVVDG